MDVKIDEVGTYFDAARRLDRYSADTQLYAFVSFITGMMAWRFEQPLLLLLAVPLVIATIYTFIKQCQARKITRRLNPRVQIFIRFYNLTGAGQPALDEVA